MDSPLPFFYYDILSRIVPGAATLSVLWQLRGFRPIDWLKNFVLAGEKDSWEKLVIPVILAGLCYAIGLFFEVFDYILDIDVPDDGRKHRARRALNAMMRFSVYIDDRAFFWAVKKRGGADDKESCGDWKKRKRIADVRSDLWERLTYLGGSDEKMKLVFAHCHRFQSEQKMFLHLIYPSALFAILWQFGFRLYYPDPFPIQDLAISLLLMIVFFWCCRSRCRRRWLQVITFSDIIKKEKEGMLAPSTCPKCGSATPNKGP